MQKVPITHQKVPITLQEYNSNMASATLRRHAENDEGGSIALADEMGLKPEMEMRRHHDTTVRCLLEVECARLQKWVGAKLMQNQKIKAICIAINAGEEGMIGKSIFDIDGEVRTLIFKIVEDGAGAYGLPLVQTVFTGPGRTGDFRFMLHNDQNILVVFNDNLLRVGNGGSAAVRGHNRAFGFATGFEPGALMSGFQGLDDNYTKFHERVYKSPVEIRDVVDDILQGSDNDDNNDDNDDDNDNNNDDDDDQASARGAAEEVSVGHSSDVGVHTTNTTSVALPSQVRRTSVRLAKKEKMNLMMKVCKAKLTKELRDSLKEEMRKELKQQLKKELKKELMKELRPIVMHAWSKIKEKRAKGIRKPGMGKRCKGK